MEPVAGLDLLIDGKKIQARRLSREHPSIGDVRSIGLFGIVELVRNRQTKEPMTPFNGNSPEMQQLGAFFKENGLYTYVHWHTFFTNPPLVPLLRRYSTSRHPWPWNRHPIRFQSPWWRCT